MKDFGIDISDFLANLQTPQNPNGKITVNPSRDADGVDNSTYTLKCFDRFGNPLPDETHPVPLRADIQSNIKELQATLDATIADEARIRAEIANYQIVDGLYDSMAPQ